MDKAAAVIIIRNSGFTFRISVVSVIIKLNIIIHDGEKL